MKNNKWFKLIGVAVLGVMILGFAVPSGQTATTATLTAVVEDQQCQGGNFVDATLTAVLDRHPHGVQYEWDFNNDGIFDTPLSPDPTVIHRYPDETNVTAVVRAVKGRRHASDAVVFSTLSWGVKSALHVSKTVPLAGACTGGKPRNVVAEIPAKQTYPQNHFQLDANAIPPAHSLDQKTYDQRDADHHTNRQGILGCPARAEKSIKPQKEAAPICCLGNSSRDGVARRSVNRWEIPVFLSRKPEA